MPMPTCATPASVAIRGERGSYNAGDLYFVDQEECSNPG